MRDALKKAGNAPKWLVESGEGHGFLDEGDRAEAFKNILDFFAKHLGSANSAVKSRH